MPANGWVRAPRGQRTQAKLFLIKKQYFPVFINVSGRKAHGREGMARKFRRCEPGFGRMTDAVESLHGTDEVGEDVDPQSWRCRWPAIKRGIAESRVGGP